MLQADNIRVHFPIVRGLVRDRTVGWVKAVDGVSLRVDKNRTLGIVGESGSGKSTLGKALLRLIEPTSGSMRVNGTDITALSKNELRLHRRSMQMVFQDPMSSLDPRQSIQSALMEPLKAHGLLDHSNANPVPEMLNQVGLPASAAGKYPHEFSGGQRQRIGIARALALQPALLVADEPVSALDVSVQAQILNLLKDAQAARGLGMLFIAHDLGVVRYVSDDISVMYLGAFVESGPSDDVYHRPLHPYTKALVSAIPEPDPAKERSRERIVLEGSPPSPANPPAGCRFNPRCPYAQPSRCADEIPALREILPGRQVACHYAEQILAGDIQRTSNLTKV